MLVASVGAGSSDLVSVGTEEGGGGHFLPGDL